MKAVDQSSGENLLTSICYPYLKPPTTSVTIQGIEFSKIKYADIGSSNCGNTLKVYGFELSAFDKRWKRDGMLKISFRPEMKETVAGSIDIILPIHSYFCSLQSSSDRANLPVPYFSFGSRVRKQFEVIAGYAKRKNRFRLGLYRNHEAMRREKPIDSIVDCCSALEAALDASERLKVSASVALLSKTNKGDKFRFVYKMYKHRNDYLHGNEIPSVSFTDQERYLEITREVLCSLPLRTDFVSSSAGLEKHFGSM